ncbi:MAG: ankyrin repeat domain-containing protein [Gemmataceae bacterium]|nr:ankyrin repeat domain-containing protein [Gemmataceae bacterium]
MRIVISGPAAAFDGDTQTEITDPAVLRRLAGLVVPDANCADYLYAPEFDELDLTGGRIETAYRSPGDLRVLTEYLTPRALSAEELAILVEYTEGQWSDGAGESGLEVTIEGQCIQIGFAPFPSGQGVEVEQLSEDPHPQPRFRRLFAAARSGDLSALRAAIAAGEDLDCRKGGMTALKWAISYGHAEAALLLIESGADAVAEDVFGDTVLVSCAASRDLSDESAARVAEQLVQRGVTAEVKPHQLEQALDIAIQRGKVQLAKVLSKAGSNGGA